MEGFPVNVTDLVIVAVVLVSGVLAFFRGMVHELFSVIGWLGAAAATYYGFGLLQPYARALIDMPLFADIGAGAAIFVVTLVVVSLLSHIIARRVKESRLGALDRSLGFVFGLLRGAVIVCIAYLMIAWALPPADQPDWLREARAMPLVVQGAKVIVLAIPPEARAEWSKRAEDAAAQTDDPLAAQRAFETLMNPPPAETGGTDTPGYTSTERKALDRLIENTQ
ncbi:MAG: CvpA family protein [Alphaproteobacteria bacterium]